MAKKQEVNEDIKDTYVERRNKGCMTALVIIGAIIALFMVFSNKKTIRQTHSSYSTSTTSSSTTSPVFGDILGTWIDDDPIFPNITYLVKKDGKTYIKQIYAKNQYINASELIIEVSQSLTNGLVKYAANNTHGDFYLLEKNGNLGLYDYDGKIKELRKKW